VSYPGPSCLYPPECVEGRLSVLRLYGVLGSSHDAGPMPSVFLMCAAGRLYDQAHLRTRWILFASCPGVGYAARGPAEVRGGS